MASFTQQTLDWRACDLAFMGEQLWEDGEEDFGQLGERAQCALMRAPLDYANPALGELQVALSRVAAEQPQQRLGRFFSTPVGLAVMACCGQHISGSSGVRPTRKTRPVSNSRKCPIVTT